MAHVRAVVAVVFGTEQFIAVVTEAVVVSIRVFGFLCVAVCISITAFTDVSREALLCAGGSNYYVLVAMLIYSFDSLGIGVTAGAGEGHKTLCKVSCRSGDLGSVAVAGCRHIIVSIVVTTFTDVSREALL